MALPQLIEAFERDTEAELAAIRTAAEAEIRAIDAEAARGRGERIASAAAATAIEHRAQADADVAAALHRARADIYAHRSAMLGRLRAEIEHQLVGLLDTEVGDALLRVAISCAGDEPGMLHCTPILALRARVLAPESLHIVADDTVATGAIIELASGTRIDATLARLLEREWPRLSGEAVRLVAKEAP
jgi:vacuolar-type H+-ATPase subunit E/Vma4